MQSEIMNNAPFSLDALPPVATGVLFLSIPDIPLRDWKNHHVTRPTVDINRGLANFAVDFQRIIAPWPHQAPKRLWVCFAPEDC